jgi:hypothetical protein
MALSTCPDCGKPVSTEAIACPHCGRPQAAAKAAPAAQQRPQVRPAFRVAAKLVAGFVGVLFIVGWILSITDHSPQTSENTVAATAPAAPPPVYKTTAPELVLAYDKNEVATNQAIGGAVVEVSGHIASIDMDAMDHAVIQMATGMNFESVGLTLEDGQKGLATKLTKNQTIVVRCKRMTRILSSPQGGDCVIVQ